MGSAVEEHPRRAVGWAARDASGHLSPFTFSRRATGESDVSFKILYSGICHSDLHYIKNEWHNAVYPAVPGNEIVGEVTEVGSKVTKFKIGDKVGVGCMVGSCNSCDNCTNHSENYCPNAIMTYGSTYHDGTISYGGYLYHGRARALPSGFNMASPLRPQLPCFALGSPCIAR